MIHQAIAGALFTPRKQIVRSLQDQPLAAVLGAFLLAAASWVLSDFLVHGKMQAVFAFVAETVLYMMLIALGLGFGMILLNFFAELLGGKGDVTALFWGMTQSATPLVLLVPLALALQWLGKYMGALYLPGKLGIFLWVMACQIVAVSEAYRVSVARATFVFFLAYGAGLIGFCALSFLLPIATIAKLALISP